MPHFDPKWGTLAVIAGSNIRFSRRFATDPGGAVSKLIPYLILIVGAAFLVGCGSDVRAEGDAPAVIAVPEDAGTIQEAVDAARPGDTIEVAPGMYQESVVVTTEDLIIRGSDRNDVVLDGKQVMANGIVVTADRVRIENLTVRNYTLNGVLVTGMSDESGGLARGSDGYHRLDPEEFPPLVGFAVRYVTATNNGLYGIYAFDAHDGLLAHNYASGSSDAGIYVGQCQKCNVVIRDNIAEYNAVGFEQANASDSVVIVRNRFSNNRLGLTLISDYQEAFVPLRGAYVAGNVISNNDNPDTPAHAEGGYGVGLGISGAQEVEARDNLITGHSRAAVEITSSEDLAPKDNRLIDNVFGANSLDVAYTASDRAPGSGNCVTGRLESTAPKGLASDWGCPDGHPESAGTQLEASTVPPGMSFREVTRPGPQPTMPDDDTFSLADSTDFDRDMIERPDAELLAEFSQAQNPGR